MAAKPSQTKLLIYSSEVHTLLADYPDETQCGIPRRHYIDSYFGLGLNINIICSEASLTLWGWYIEPSNKVSDDATVVL